MAMDSSGYQKKRVLMKDWVKISLFSLFILLIMGLSLIVPELRRYRIEKKFMQNAGRSSQPPQPLRPSPTPINVDPDTKTVEDFFNGIKSKDFDLWLSYLRHFQKDLDRIKRENPQVMWDKKISEAKNSFKQCFDGFFNKLSFPISYSVFRMDPSDLVFVPPTSVKVLEKRKQHGIAGNVIEVFVELEFPFNKVKDKYTNKILKKVIISIYLDNHRIAASADGFPRAINCHYGFFPLAIYIVNGSEEYYT